MPVYMRYVYGHKLYQEDEYMANIQSGKLLDLLGSAFKSLSNALQNVLNNVASWADESDVTIDPKKVKTTEDGGIIFQGEFGDGQRFKVKAVPIADTDKFTMYVKSDNGKKQKYDNVTEKDFTKKLVDFAERFMDGAAVEDTYEDVKEHGNIHDSEADFDINESKHLQISLRKVVAENEIQIELMSVNANYSPSEALVDIQTIVEDDSILPDIDETPVSFDIAVTEDSYDLCECNCVDLNSAFDHLVTAAYTVYLNLQALHWNSMGKKFMRIHTMIDDYLSYIRDMIDRLAEINLQTHDYMVNPVILAKDAIVMVSDGNIEGDIAASEAESVILHLVDVLNLYYPNMDHDVQSEFDEWIGYLKSEALYKLRRM